ncbi:MAG: ATP-grasp domain-containing protein [Desulfovibrio sp.]
MPPESVLVLGASRYYAGSIRQIAEMGLRVVVTDGNPKAFAAGQAHVFHAVDITDVDATLHLAEREGVSAVVALNDYGVRTAAAVSEALNLRGIGVQAAFLATDKLLMRQAWRKAGAPQPHFALLSPTDPIPASMAQLPGNGQLVVKPAESRGGASRGVVCVHADKIAGGDLAEAVEYARSFYPDKRVLIEECVQGSEHSLELIGCNGEVQVLCIGDKRKTPYPHRVDTDVIYPTALAGEQRREAERAAIQGALALGLKTFAAHVELCLTADGPRLFELGARFGGGHTASHILPQVTGRKYLQDHVRLLLRGGPMPPAPGQEQGCVYKFLTPPPGRLVAVRGLEQVLDLPGVLDAGLFVKAGDTVPLVRTGPDRSGFIVAAGNNRNEALELAHRAQAMLDFQYAEE